jgi:hypothetical protein
VGLPTRTLALLCGAWLAVGCASEDERTPAACLELDGPSTVRAALRSAPGPVRVEGQPLSACLHGKSDAGALRDVGLAYVEAAAGLAEEAEARPHGASATQLGYLIGATRRGAARAQGVADELMRRLEQEVGRVDERSPAFTAGERAGRSGG